ncbi:MAG: R3H domain-containing nucleic acid-binding protein [Candidatus Gracilibacteria bacterium]
MQQQIQEIARNFFTLMRIEFEDVIVECQDEKKGIYLIQVKTPDSKILIGIHGQTLEMMKHLLSRILEKTLDTSLLIHLEVNDYLQAKDEKFYRYLEGRIAYAMRSREELILPNLSSYDRKKAHGYISDKKIEGLKTFSVGEGKDRALHLSYAGPKIVSSHPTPVRKVSELIDDDGIGI